MMRIRLVVLFVINIFIFPVYALQPGTYNFDNDEGYFVETKFGQNRVHNLMKVSWKDRVSKIIYSNSDGISGISKSFPGEFISYSDRGTVNIIDAKNYKSVKTFDYPGKRQVHWSTSGNKMTVYDTNGENIVEYNVDNQDIRKIKYNGRLWAVKWSTSCDCFLYLLDFKSDKEAVGHSSSNTYKMGENKFVKIGPPNIITSSPDGMYKYFVRVGFESPNYIDFMKKDGALISSYGTSGILNEVHTVLWGDKRARVLWLGGNVDLRTGSLLNKNYYMWPVNQSRNLDISREDVAADPNGYVLIWNNKKTIFEVEDINTGKIVKTYERFWEK